MTEISDDGLVWLCNYSRRYRVARVELLIGVLCIAMACRTESVYKFSRPLPASAGALRKYITAVEYTKYHGSNPLFSGQDTDNPPDAIYEVDSSSDLVISFSPNIRDLGGSVSVRARLLRSPVVELPVQNFTTVTEKDLKKETVLLLPRESSLFRDDKYHREVQIQLTVAQSSSVQFGGYISAQILSLLGPFSEKPPTLSPSKDLWRTRPVDEVDYASSLTRLIEGLNRADVLRVAAHDSLVRLRDTLRDLFLGGEFISDISNRNLAEVKRIARLEMDAIQTQLVAIDNDYTLYTKLFAQCSANPNLAYRITKANVSLYPSAQDIGVNGSSIGVLAKDDVIYAAKEDKSLRIISPKSHEGKMIDAKQAIPLGRQTGVLLCAQPLFSDLLVKLRNDFDTTRAIRAALTRPSDLSKGCHDKQKVTSSSVTSNADVGNGKEVTPGETDEAPKAAPKERASGQSTLPGIDDSPPGISDAIDAMECIVQNDIEDNLAARIHDARVSLRESELVHGDVISVSVAVAIPAIGFSRTTLGSSPEATVIEERIVLRVIDRGWSFSTRPQFALIKRQSDVVTGTAKDSPSNFKPAPGVLLNFRYRTNHRSSDWAIPSFGIAAFAVDFDPGKTFELGVGPSFGFLNDFIHLGGGYNLSADTHGLYYFVGLDFLRTFDTFSTIFGGGGK